jgi:hypothetical protein
LALDSLSCPSNVDALGGRPACNGSCFERNNFQNQKEGVLVQRCKQPLSGLESKEEPSKLDCDQQLHHHRDRVEMMLLVGSETGDLREPRP